ncbi:MAG TPA: DinB family protein [Dehalococcoidia bacterium]|nr:DinB family protein [Dehalococcoidia bacterium]
MNEVLVELYRHNTWANTKLIEFVRDLPEATRESDVVIEGTRGPIADTLLHITLAQEFYLSMFGRGERPANNDFPGWEALLERNRRCGEGFVAVAAEVDGDAMMDGRFRGEPTRMAASVILTQVINHATDHRSQVATALTQLGVTPPALDSWSFGREDGRML